MTHHKRIALRDSIRGEPQRSASQSINSKDLTTMAYQHIKVPEQGTPITANEDHSLNVPNTPIIPYIEGDGLVLISVQ